MWQRPNFVSPYVASSLIEFDGNSISDKDVNEALSHLIWRPSPSSQTIEIRVIEMVPFFFSLLYKKLPRLAQGLAMAIVADRLSG